MYDFDIFGAARPAPPTLGGHPSASGRPLAPAAPFSRPMPPSAPSAPVFSRASLSPSAAPSAPIASPAAAPPWQPMVGERERRWRNWERDWQGGGWGPGWVDTSVVEVIPTQLVQTAPVLVAQPVPTYSDGMTDVVVMDADPYAAEKAVLDSLPSDAGG
jgi:hypothetical protein